MYTCRCRKLVWFDEPSSLEGQTWTRKSLAVLVGSVTAISIQFLLCRQARHSRQSAKCWRTLIGACHCQRSVLQENVVCNPLQWYGQACLCATNDNLTAAGCRPFMFLCGNFRPSFACPEPVSCPIISQTGTDSECIWSKYTTFEVEVGQLTNEYVQ